MTGREVMKEDYSHARIRVAFRPADGTFTVTDTAVEHDPEYIPNISVLWESDGGRRRAVRTFLKGLAEKRGELSQDEEDRLEDAIDRLYDLRNYPFKVVELSPEVDEEQVAEVFVRINSEGVTLNQADFILTLMSVFWEKGRQQLEDFSRDARPHRCQVHLRSTGTSSPHPRSCCGSRSRSRSDGRCSVWPIRCYAAKTSTPADSIQTAAPNSSRACKPPRNGYGPDQLARVPAMPGTGRLPRRQDDH